MKKITLLLILLLSLNASSQISNVTLPTQVKTSANGGGDVNTYTVSFDYSFDDQDDFNKLGYTTIRIRPITSPETKDPYVNNTDLAFTPSFKDYVTENGLSGSYSIALNMPKDLDLPSSATRRNNANPGYGYDTRLQWGYPCGTNGACTGNLQTPFVAIEVLDSNGVLSTKDLNTTKLEATFYSSKRDALIVNDRISGKFIIYNLKGQSVLKGNISKEINVETLKSGLYFLTTEKGVLKFAK